MKKNSLLSILTAICAIATIDVLFGGTINWHLGDSFLSKSNIPITTYTHDLDPLIVVSQNVNQKGLVVMSDLFTNPFNLTWPLTTEQNTIT